MRICPQCGAETTALTCRNDGFGTVDAGRYRRLDPSHLLGTLFQDRYRIDAVLGSGGMGSVYRATQVRVGRQVALKVINADLAYDLAVVARFQREGRAIATLIHPNIVQVYDFGQTDDGELFMAMELVQGRTLADVIREEAPIEPGRVVQIGAQFFDALAEAHEHGVIHRDLKPENIFITETGRRRDVVKILDFGVAKIVNEPKSESMVTARGAILGSPKYMAPEQARGKGVTGHADLYAAGGILYEALTGRAVFNEPSPADYLVAHSVKMPSAPTVNGRELRGPLVDLIMKCLEKKPWNRPDGAGRALEAIEAARLSPVLEPGDNAPVVVAEIPTNQDSAPRRLVRPVVVEGGEIEVEAQTETTAVVVAVTTPPPPMPETQEAPEALETPQAAKTTPVRRERHAVETPLMPAAAESAGADDDRVQVPTPMATPSAPAMDDVPQPVDTRQLVSTAPMASRVPIQDEPTIVADAVETEDQLRSVYVVEEDRERTGGLWLLAALLLLFVGAFVYLAANDFFRGGSPEATRVASSAHVRGVIEDHPSANIGPARPSPGPTEPVAAETSGGPIPGEASSDGAVAKAVAGATVDEAAKAGDETAKAGDETAKAGDETAKAGDETAKAGDETAKAGDETAKAGDETAKAGDETAKAGDETAKAGDPAAKAGDEAAKAGDEAGKSEPAWVEVAREEEPGPKAPEPRTTKPVKTPRRTTPTRTAERRPSPPVATPDPFDDLADPDFPQRPQKEDDNIHRVLVDSTPSGAEIKMGALPLGKTPLRVEWKDLGQPVHVTITKEGYFPHHITLSAAQAKVGVTLRPSMQAPPGG